MVVPARSARTSGSGWPYLMLRHSLEDGMVQRDPAQSHDARQSTGCQVIVHCVSCFSGAFR
jgi:hypothetical protein